MAANNDRVVYPDEVEAVKEAAAKSSAGQPVDNSVEQQPADAPPKIAVRNMIQVPDNCPPGYKLIDGVCREVFD